MVILYPIQPPISTSYCTYNLLLHEKIIQFRRNKLKSEIVFFRFRAENPHCGFGDCNTVNFGQLKEINRKNKLLRATAWNYK